jgi:hypothetical protein
LIERDLAGEALAIERRRCGDVATPKGDVGEIRECERLAGGVAARPPSRQRFPGECFGAIELVPAGELDAEALERPRQPKLRSDLLGQGQRLLRTRDGGIPIGRILRREAELIQCLRFGQSVAFATRERQHCLRRSPLSVIVSGVVAQVCRHEHRREP